MSGCCILFYGRLILLEMRFQCKLWRSIRYRFNIVIVRKLHVILANEQAFCKRTFQDYSIILYGNATNYI